jgi:2-polyprenyl-6-methoxyphenol hydroxylase-like FAD-dependent oxidoreductase
MVTLDDGRQFEGDILVGADGIWSEVIQMLNCMITNQFQQLTVIFCLFHVLNRCVKSYLEHKKQVIQAIHVIVD